MPVPGTSVFFTVKLGTGFVTVDVHSVAGMHGPVVMVAVFFTLVVSVVFTLAVKVTFTEWPAARVTWMVSLAALYCHRAGVCGGDCGAGQVEAVRVRFEATGQ